MPDSFAQPLNAKAFYVKAISPGYDEVYYRTGDIVRRGPDGLLYFVGRKDNQFKIRGFRVELEEIDAILSAHKGVSQACSVIIRSDIADEIAAMIVAKPDISVCERTSFKLYASVTYFVCIRNSAYSDGKE